MSKFMGYDYNIIYKKGSKNSGADALSNVSGVEIFNITVSSLNPLLLDRIILSYTIDTAIQQLLNQLQQGNQSANNYVMDGRMLRKK